MIKRTSEDNKGYWNSKETSLNHNQNKIMKKTQIEKTIDFVRGLNTSIKILEEGRRETRYVFSDKELKDLENVYISDLELLLGEEKAQFLFVRLVQNCLRRWTSPETRETISLADIKEFSYYGEDLSADHGARQILMARNLTKLNEISR